MTADQPATVNPGTASAAPAWTEAERVARASYGRLLALLAAPGGDIALAEDCLAEAFERALRVWPTDGVPENPEGWILTVARNRRRDVFRSAAHQRSSPLDDLASVPEAAPEAAPDSSPGATSYAGDGIPDRRLALLFVCAHPAIAPEIRAPLMLQTALGFDAKQIARVYAVPTATMAQRLVRAKRRIRDARIPFVVPNLTEMPGRLEAVLEAIYGAYAIDWPLVSGPTVRDSIAAEALYLAVTLAELLGDQPEAFGLAALIALSMSRTDARGLPDGFIPLAEQDPALWDPELIAQGEAYLRRAQRLGRIGRFQLEAAIQSVHCARATSGATDWSALRTLYGGLVAVAPTLGSRVALAATIGRLDGADAGMAALDAIEDEAISRFQPAWATRAHLLARAGRAADAILAYDRAIALTTEPPIRQYLIGRRQALRGGMKD